MKDEMTGNASGKPTDQERLMALLALTAQELPIQPRVAEEAGIEPAVDREFRRLDSDPAMLESYLRRGMRPLTSKQKASRLSEMVQTIAEWLAPPRMQFAAAAAAVVIGSLIFWQVRSTSLLDAVEHGYTANIALPAEGMVLPWERRGQTQGFSTQAGNETDEGRAFASGLLRARVRMQGGDISNANLTVSRANEKFVALGEWNAFLWSASAGQPNFDTEFWNKQLSIARLVSAAFATGSIPSVAAHTTIVEGLVADMAQQPDARKARRLAEELMRFREAFAPLRMETGGRPDTVPIR